MKHISWALLTAIVVLVPAVRTEAAPIVFDFTFDFTDGPLTGTSVTGNLSVDDADCTAPGGLCSGTFIPDGPLHLLSFAVTVAGVTFTSADDIIFPERPSVTFSDDVITSLSYRAVLQDAILDISTDEEPDVIFIPLPSEDSSSGNFVGGTRQLAPVPEPASMTLLGIGLAGMAGRRWRQRKLS